MYLFFLVSSTERGRCSKDDDEREGTVMWSTETNKLYPEVEGENVCSRSSSGGRGIVVQGC